MSESRVNEEVTLRESMDEIILWYRSTSILSIDHQHGQNTTPLIGDFEIYSSAICKQIDLLLSIKESDHFNSFSEQTSYYEDKFVLLNDIMTKLNEAQKKWCYLEPIYANGTITVQQDIFQRANDGFRSIMRKNGNTKLKSLTDEKRNNNLNENISYIIMDLNKCQKSITRFLEEKRSSCPRLYFLGDDSLLEMIGHSTQSERLQPHMKHLFQAINSLVFDNLEVSILGFKSAEGEEVLLNKVISQHIALRQIIIEWIH